MTPDPARPVRIGTRGSPLALAQAVETRRLLMAAHGWPEDAFAIVPVKTTADRVQDRALRDIGGKGLFTKEIEDGLLDGTLDIAVHCVKDMPVLAPPGLVLDAYMAREDVRDAFISQAEGQAGGLAGLPRGAVVGTSSLRRRAQLLHRRPDLRVVEFRGNVQTRLKKLSEGVAEATFLAMAGLNRLGMADLARAPLAVEEMLPAVGQGALVIERREQDAAMAALIAPLHDAATAGQMAAERAYLARLDGSCQTPIAGLAEIAGDRLRLRGEILRPDGSERIADEIAGPVAEGAALGEALADRLLSRAPEDFFR